MPYEPTSTIVVTSTLVVKHIILDSPLANTSTNYESTNTGKQTISYMVSIFWYNIPSFSKSLNAYQFSLQIKLYLFSDKLEITMK